MVTGRRGSSGDRAGASALFCYCQVHVKRMATASRCCCYAEMAISLQQVVRAFNLIRQCRAAVVVSTKLLSPDSTSGFSATGYSAFEPYAVFCSFLQAKGEYRSEDLNQAATTILDILLKCQQHSAAQVKLSNACVQSLQPPYVCSLVWSWCQWRNFCCGNHCYRLAGLLLLHNC